MIHLPSLAIARADCSGDEPRVRAKSRAGMTAMIELTCHCGAVRIEVPEAPETVTSCNCSLCRRTGALMAYYSPSKVRFTPSPPPTDTYQWGDKSIAHHRCRTCGCLTHWSAVDPAYDRMDVNMRLADPEVLAKARIRRFDGAETSTFLDP